MLTPSTSFPFPQFEEMTGLRTFTPYLPYMRRQLQRLEKGGASVVCTPYKSIVTIP